jgi:hypothetical protein
MPALRRYRKQKENDAADVQRARVNISGFLGTMTFDEFELLAIALLRANHH